MNNSIRGWKILLSGFGSGRLPLAPGTWGAALAVLMAWPLTMLPASWVALSLLALILVSFWIGVIGSERVHEEWGDDPKQTVIDEMMGVWIALLGIPLTWPWMLAAFLLFRFFDIAKPLGVRQAEKLEGGWGIMIDDALAGVYANIVLQCALLFYVN